MFGKDKKKRSRRVNTKYGQKTLKHARKGIQSCMMAVLCAVILIVLHCLHWQFMDSDSDFGV